MLTITEVNLPEHPVGSRGHDLSRTVPRTGALPPTLGPKVSDEASIRGIALGDRHAMELLLLAT